MRRRAKVLPNRKEHSDEMLQNDGELFSTNPDDHPQLNREERENLKHVLPPGRKFCLLCPASHLCIQLIHTTEKRRSTLRMDDTNC